MTKYKKAILQIIDQSYNHLTAEEVFKTLKKDMPGVVLATIYNNLNSLVEEGLIRKISVEGKVDRFDKIKRHDHLICKRCGKIVDFTYLDLSKTLSKQIGSNILGYDLKVFVLCDSCKNKMSK